MFSFLLNQKNRCVWRKPGLLEELELEFGTSNTESALLVTTDGTDRTLSETSAIDFFDSAATGGWPTLRRIVSSVGMD